MNREVEERIVAMYFDNQDFEKNAKTTIETLGQLKEGLNLEGTAQKGFSIFEKIGKTLDFTKANQGLQKMKTTMSGMGNIFKKIFGIKPIEDAYKKLDKFTDKYVNRVIGFDIANKLVSSMESIFRQLTVQPISAGWDQYQAKMDSVKTIMTSTGESIEVVNSKLAEMTEYANKTIYSLTDMTSNLGKFTNNGVKLDDAVQAMEGIANATAHAGQGSQAASMAMYNISQAMGVGKMTTVDWKSLENANVATMQLKNTFLEVAAAAGKIKKEVVKAGDTTRTVFKLTTDENGKQLKQEIELTAENFREYLSKGWLDKETMLRTFQIYSGQGIDENTLKSWGITDPELIKQMYKLGEEAMEAATQVRTAGKMLDALKESVQSGWADSFEIIFGNMEEGTQLWTKMNEKIDAVLSASTKRRNDILKKWAEMTEDGRSYWVKDDKGNDVKSGIEGGREILMNTFFELMGVAKTVGSTISDAFSKVFGKLDAKKLFNLTIGFRNLVKNIKTWLNTTQNGTTRLQKLQKGLQGVFSIVKVGINFIKIIVNLGKRLLGPILDWAVTAFEAVGKFFDNLGDMKPATLFKAVGNRLKNVWKDITNFFKKENGQTESPFETWVKNAWNGFKEIIKNWLKDVGLEGVWNSITTWWHDIKQAFIDGWTVVSTWWNGSGIPDFFKGIWNEIMRWFTPETGENGEVKNAPIVQFFIDIGDAIDGAFKDLQTWWEGSGIPEFFERIWNEVVRWFTPTTIVGKQGNSWTENAPIVQFFVDLGDKIDNAFKDLQTWWEGSGIPEFFERIWNEVVRWFTPTTIVGKQGYTWTEDSPIVSFFKGIWTGIESAYNGLSEWWDSSGIPEFFQRIWNEVVEWFTPITVTGKQGYTWTEDSPIVSFFKGIWTGIESAYNGLKTWWEGSGIPEFFERIWNEVVRWFTPTTIVGKQGNSWTEDSPVVTFFKDIWEGIKSIYDTLKSWWESDEVQGTLSAIGEFFTDAWNWVIGLFGGGSESSDPAAKSAKAAGRMRAAATTINDVGWVSTKIAKDTPDNATDVEKKTSIFKTIIDTIRDFITNIVNSIKGWTIPDEVTTFLNGMKELIKGLLVAFGEFFGSLGKLLKGESKWFDDNPDFWNVAIPGIILGIIEAFNLIKLKLMGGITATTVGHQFLEIAGGIFLLAAGVTMLVAIDQEKVWQAVGIVTILGVIVGIITGIIAYITKLKTSVADAPVTSSERIITTLISTLGKIAIIWVAMEMLPKIIETIGKVKKDLGDNAEGLGNDILNTFLGISALIAAVGIVMSIITKMSPAGINAAAAVSSAFSIMAVIAVVITSFEAILGIIGGISDAIGGKQNTDKVCDIIDQGGKILNHIALALNGFVAGLLGIKTQEQKAAESLNILNMLGDSLKMFDTEKVSSISRLMTLLTQITSNYDSFDASKLAGFSTSVGEVGRAVYEFVRYLNLEGSADALKDLHDPSSEVYQRLIGFTEVGKRLGDMLHSFGGASSEYGLNATFGRLTELAKPENLQNLVDSLNRIMAGLGTLDRPEDGIQFDGLSIVQRLYEAIQQGLNDPHLPPFDAESVVQAIVNALLVGKDSIAFLVHEMVQEGLKLSNDEQGAGTFKLSDENVEWLQNFMNGDATKGVTGIVENFDDTQITGIVDQLSAKIPSLESLFKGKGWMDFKDENGNEIDILGQVQEHLNSVGTTLDTMEPLKITITPVIDFDQIKPEKLQEQLDGKPIELNSIFNLPSEGLKIDFTGLDTALSIGTILERLQGIIAQVYDSSVVLGGNIDALGSHMDGIATEVSRLQLVLDTGALVGQITPMVDQKLGEIETYSSRL